MFVTAILSEVIQLTNETFATSIEKPTLVKFFAPWCGHCKELAPKYENMSVEVTDVVIAELDCTQFEQICDEQKIEGFPTLKFYFKGNAYNFQGDREAEPIKNWLKKMQQPMFEWKTNEQLTKEMEEAGVSGFFVLQTSDLEAAEAQFARYKGTVVIGAQKAEQQQIIAFREGKEVIFNGNVSDEEALDKFFSMNTLPFCPIVSSRNFQQLLMSGFPFVMFSANLSAEQNKAAIDQFKQLARENDKYVHALIDSTIFSRFVEMLRGTEAPTIFVIEPSESQRAFSKIIEGELKAEYEKFMKDFDEGILEPIELKVDEPEEEHGNRKMLKLINTIIFGGLALAAVFAVWFACKCIRSGKKQLNIEPEPEVKEVQAHEEQQEEQKDDKTEQPIPDDKKND